MDTVTVTLTHDDLRVLRDALDSHKEALQKERADHYDEAFAEEYDDDICAVYELKNRILPKL